MTAREISGNRIGVRDDLAGMKIPQPPSAPTTGRRRVRGGLALLAGGALALSACGSDDPEATLTGVVRDPAPQVDEVSLPSLSDPGEEVQFRAEPGEVEVVYFGYTACPDVCPTTMSDLAVALRQMDPEDAERVSVVMVTVDPDRDLDVLDGYVTSFVPDATAAGTLDAELATRAGEQFGASWEVRTVGDTVEVDHSPFLYAVDDQGRLAVTWQFGASSEDMASDLEVLLERAEA